MCYNLGLPKLIDLKKASMVPMLSPACALVALISTPLSVKVTAPLAKFSLSANVASGFAWNQFSNGNQLFFDGFV